MDRLTERYVVGPVSPPVHGVGEEDGHAGKEKCGDEQDVAPGPRNDDHSDEAHQAK